MRCRLLTTACFEANRYNTRLITRPTAHLTNVSYVRPLFWADEQATPLNAKSDRLLMRLIEIRVIAKKVIHIGPINAYFSLAQFYA